eukprot:snap_masked-scaffold_79-processed-gene-0.36-mRNA-1 protein AED:1.00 eAED:1.00 QI:0/0/0/0/1/1/3/0/134
MEIELLLKSLKELFLKLLHVQEIKKEKKVKLLKIRTLMIGLTYFLIKDILDGKAAYPYFLSSSLLFSVLIANVNIVIYFYFHKYSKYHLEKARLMYSLKVRFHGVNVENLFKYHISYSFAVTSANLFINKQNKK